MSILLETNFGDLVVDLDVEGSPALAKNILKLAKARYYSNTLIYNVVPGKYSQMGDPKGDGTGGCSIYGLMDSYQSLPSSTKSKTPIASPPDVTKNQRRFLQSHGRQLTPSELNQKGVVIAMEIGNVPHTIGSQFLITLSDNNGLKDLVPLDDEGGADGAGDQNTDDYGGKIRSPRYLSLGKVAEDSQHVLSKLNRAYCDDDGRPYADIRIQRALVVHDPFEDPAGMENLLKLRGVGSGDTNAISDETESDLADGYPLAPLSPNYERPPEETVSIRIQADDTTLFATAGWDDEDNVERLDEDEEDEEARQKRLELQRKQEEEWRKRQDTSRAVMLEMLGDLPSADIQAPENVLFVCKLNPLTNDEDLELIFSRFDSTAKAEIIRDPDSGASLQYAFVEFSTNEACNEAYLKMNNALVDDRRIRVDFSQSVAKVWDRYHKRYRKGLGGGIDRGFLDGGGRGRGRGGRGGGGRGRGGRGGGDRFDGRGRITQHHHQSNHHDSRSDNYEYRASRRAPPNGRNDRHESYDKNEGHTRREEENSRDRYGSRRSNSSESRNRYIHRESRSRSPYSDYKRSRSKSRSDSRHRRRHSRSRSDSRDHSRRDHSRSKKRHKRERHRDRKDRSRSHERDRKRKKKHRHSSRREKGGYSDEEDGGRERSREHRSRRSRDVSDESVEDNGRRDRKKSDKHRHSDRKNRGDRDRRTRDESRSYK